MAVVGVGYALIQVPFVLFDDDEDYSELFDEENEPISDWKETPEARILQAELPGLNKEDIKVEIKNYRVLTISGGFTPKDTNNGKIAKRTEAFFIRQVTLPDDVKPKDMTATVADGVLIIKAPKSSKPKPSTRLLAITN